MTAPLPPGAYLRLRREAAGLSLDDVALAIGTIPALPALSRVEWLAQIEAGIAPLQVDVALALRAHPALSFDWNVLLRLCAIAGGLDREAPRLCRVCACSEHDACLTADRAPCAWAAEDLCTGCAPTPVASGSAAA